MYGFSLQLFFPKAGVVYLKNFNWKTKWMTYFLCYTRSWEIKIKTTTLMFYFRILLYLICLCVAMKN